MLVKITGRSDVLLACEFTFRPESSSRAWDTSVFENRKIHLPSSFGRLCRFFGVLVPSCWVLLACLGSLWVPSASCGKEEDRREEGSKGGDEMKIETREEYIQSTRF